MARNIDVPRPDRSTGEFRRPVRTEPHREPPYELPPGEPTGADRSRLKADRKTHVDVDNGSLWVSEDKSFAEVKFFSVSNISNTALILNLSAKVKQMLREEGLSAGGNLVKFQDIERAESGFYFVFFVRLVKTPTARVPEQA